MVGISVYCADLVESADEKTPTSTRRVRHCQDQFGPNRPQRGTYDARVHSKNKSGKVARKTILLGTHATSQNFTKEIIAESYIFRRLQ